jgi:hypothetical protein
MAEVIQAFVERRVGRYGLGASLGREQNYERECLLSEVSMRVFCTEVPGFSTEVWERLPRTDMPDPLKLLYGERQELITQLTGQPARRVLTFLFPDTQDGVREVLHESRYLPRA